mgnify:CR=1 FL=1
MKKLTLLALFITPSLLFAQPKGLDKKAESILPKVIEWRRHLHQYPELSNREYKTADYIAAHLTSLRNLKATL